MNVVQKVTVSGWFPTTASRNAARKWLMDEVVELHGKRIAEVECFDADPGNSGDGRDYKATMTVLLSAPDWAPRTEVHLVRGEE